MAPKKINLNFGIHWNSVWGLNLGFQKHQACTSFLGPSLGLEQLLLVGRTQGCWESPSEPQNIQPGDDLKLLCAWSLECGPVHVLMV